MCVIFCEYGISNEFALQKLKGGGAYSHECNVFLPPVLSLVHPLFKLPFDECESLRLIFVSGVSLLILLCNYLRNNFQRLMSRLEHWWRAQRSVISIVNCRIPWTNRVLNAYCAFGISLKACLLQSLLHLPTLVLLRCMCAALSNGETFLSLSFGWCDQWVIL